MLGGFGFGRRVYNWALVFHAGQLHSCAATSKTQVSDRCSGNHNYGFGNQVGDSESKTG